MSLTFITQVYNLGSTPGKTMPSINRVAFVTKKLTTLRASQGFFSMITGNCIFPSTTLGSTAIVYDATKNKFFHAGSCMDEEEWAILPHYFQVLKTPLCAKVIMSFIEDYLFWDVDEHKIVQYPMHWSCQDKFGTDVWHSLNGMQGTPTTSTIMKGIVAAGLTTFEVDNSQVTESPKKMKLQKQLPKYAWILRKGIIQTFPREEGWPFPKNYSNKSIEEIMNELELQTEGEF